MDLSENYDDLLNDSTSDSDSSGDSEDFEKQEEIEEQKLTEEEVIKYKNDLITLESQIQKEPFDYEVNVNLIHTLQALKETDKLEVAREAMSSKFPLTEKLWLDWIKDRKAKATTPEDHKNLEDLFKRATKDYICPRIWLEYIQYSIRLLGQDEGKRKLRSIIEEAISEVGLHVTDGFEVWAVYREIETLMLSQMQPAPGSITTPDQNDSLLLQVKRISSIYKRQLSIPLLDMEDTMSEYESWRMSLEDGEIDQFLMKSYQEASNYLQTIKSFEDQIESDSSYTGYLPYIEHEKAKNDPSRIRCLYERCVVSNCLDSQLWNDYLSFMKSTYHHGSILQNLYERALRNLPWISQYWQDYLLLLEKDDADLQTLEKVFQNALQAGFTETHQFSQLWMVWVTILRRKFSNSSGSSREMFKQKIRSCFHKAVESLEPKVFESKDGYFYFALLSYWGVLEASQFDDLDKSREIFKDLMKKHSSARLQWSLWSDYFEIERRFGSSSDARLVLHQALQSCAADNGDAEFVCSRLMRLERECGTLKELEDSEKKIASRMKKVNKRKERLQTNQINNRQNYNKKFKKNFVKESNQKFDKNSQKNKEKPTNEITTSKRPQVFQNKDSWDNKRIKLSEDSDLSFKTPTGLPPRYNKTKKAEIKPLDEVPDTKEIFSQIREETGTNSPDSPKPTVSTTEQDEYSDENLSVFVSNLDFKLSNVEETLKKFFDSCKSLTNIRVIRKKSGASRGFAYISFSEKEDIKKALFLDRQMIEGRPVFVSPNTKKDTKAEIKPFKYSDNMERHKLFVSSLSPSTTEDSLKRLFSQHGDLKSVRIVINRGGYSKCIAYVEYLKATDASKAVFKCDGALLDGAKIEVAISNPPKRNQKQPVANLRNSKTKVDFNQESDVDDQKTNPKMDNAAFAALFRKT